MTASFMIVEFCWWKSDVMDEWFLCGFLMIYFFRGIEAG